MRIKITKGGIYGATDEIAIGTELTVKSEPLGWKGRYEVIGKTEGKTPVTNEPPTTPAKTPAEVLALAETAHFMTFKAEATKLLGDKTPASKAEMVTALEELATKP